MSPDDLANEFDLSTSRLADLRSQGKGPPYFKLGGDRYLLDSGRPNRLWFRLFLRIGMDDLIQGNGIDCDGLLREPEEEFASAL